MGVEQEILPGPTSGDSTSPEVVIDTAERDFEAEARQHGWTPKEEFRGDASRWVDAETFVKRADEVMPFLKKQNTALKRDLDDMKRQMKRANEFFSQAEERAYNRALSELQRKHDEAVESGDVAAGRKVVQEMKELEKDFANKPGLSDTDPELDPEKARKELNAWVEKNDWYVLDDKKRSYADLQANLMGPAVEWEGGQQAWLDELSKRVERKFSEPKPNPANPGGNRGGARGSAKGFADLPREAQQIADKWIKQGIIKNRDAYVKAYKWD
jgi:hypothetical protein